MAGAFSGHLIDYHNPNSPFNSSIVSHGAMSFNPNMHGTPYAQQSFSLFGPQPSFANDSISEETSRKIATLQVKLNQKLGPEYISQRPGPGGGPKLTYVEGWKIINLANEVFGFNGWSSSIVSLTTDFVDYIEESRRYNVGVTALMRVTLRDGVFHEDIGYGMLENSKSKGAALDKCKKEAVTDGLKRALRSFGNVLGNCLYDKSYTQEVIKIKFEPTKLNKDGLHRRPEFEDVKPDVSSSAVASTASTSRSGHSNNTNTVTPSRPTMQQNQAKPLTSIPPHMRSEVHASGSGSNGNSRTSDTKGKGPAYPQHQQPAGLNNAFTTPMHPPAQPSFAPQQALNPKVAFAQPAPAPVSKPPHQATVAKHEPQDDHDDSQGFFDSDDDAFLATADLEPHYSAEADIGRPIVADMDMGRPIDHEEGLLRSPDDHDDEEVSTNDPPAVKSAPARAKNNLSAAKSRHELIAAALSGGADASNASASGSNSAAQEKPAPSHLGLATGMLSKNLPQQQPRPNGMSMNGSSSTTASSSSRMRPPPPPQPRATSMAQQNHQRYMNQRQNDQNQNPVPQILQTSSTSGDAIKRVSTPSSMGGFNFPPGMNPLISTGNTPSSALSAASAGSGIGVKRPADAMSSSNSMFRPGRQGMGLQQQPGGGGANSVVGQGFGAISNNVNGNGRSVLGALDITDGGDVKRRRS